MGRGDAYHGRRLVKVEDDGLWLAQPLVHSPVKEDRSSIVYRDMHAISAKNKRPAGKLFKLSYQLFYLSF